MTYDKAEDEGYLVAKRMMRNHERITERTGSILAREFADDYAYSDTPVSPSRLKEAFLRGFDKGVEDAIEGRRDPKGRRRPARKPARKTSTRGSGYYVGPTPSGRLYFYKTKSEARSAAKAMAKNMRRSVEIRARGTSATKWKGRLVERVKPTTKGRGSRRDISRVDLKHLSGAALLKLLRQAMKAGDEEKAEMIGKELDRRGEGFRRTGRDEAWQKVRTLVALLPVHAGSYHVIAYTRSSSAGHISTKKLGSYRSKAKGKAHLNRARSAMRGKKGRGTSIGFVDATSMKLLPFSRMLQRRLAPYRKARA